jgi:hypothetical protein
MLAAGDTQSRFAARVYRVLVDGWRAFSPPRLRPASCVMAKFPT